MILRLRPVPAGLNPLSFSYIVSTWFHSGRIRPASGSWGSLAALPVCWAIKDLGGNGALAVFALLVALIGTWAIHRYLEHSQNKDPSEIVIDEVLGMAVLFLVLPSHAWMYIGIGFAVFRLLDSIKPFPIGWCDKHIKGAWGVMCDDLVAGVLSAVILWALQYPVL